MSETILNIVIEITMLQNEDKRVRVYQSASWSTKIVLENVDSGHIFQNSSTDTTINPKGSQVQSQQSTIFYFFTVLSFYPKNKFVSLGTLGVETCQFLKWPNTEGLISSVCSLSVSITLLLCVCAHEIEKKKQEGRRVCVQMYTCEKQKRSRMKWDTRPGKQAKMDAAHFHPILHSVPQWESGFT